MNTCALEGCDKKARSNGIGALCPMHYHRRYRHGDVEKVATRLRLSAGRRYVMKHAARHPLADKAGRVYVHRMVLFDTIGPGEHACHWCGTDLEWLPKGDPRAIQADHLNAIGDDNRPENLVPACFRCNSARGSQARHDRLASEGWWSVNDTVAVQGRAPRVS